MRAESEEPTLDSATSLLIDSPMSPVLLYRTSQGANSVAPHRRQIRYPETSSSTVNKHTWASNSTL